METIGRKFTMRDEAFTCVVCGHEVEPLGYTARDHCPYCLCSRHVDVFPGDRENTCGGVMEPVGLEKAGNRYKIVYRCTVCGARHRNIAAQDDDSQMLIELSSRPVEE